MTNCCYRLLPITGGGSMMMWEGFSCMGIEKLVRPNGKIDTWELLIKSLFEASKNLRLQQRLIFEQDNDSENTGKVTLERFRSKYVYRLEWHSQSPNINRNENLWRDLKIDDQRCFLFFFLKCIKHFDLKGKRYVRWNNILHWKHNFCCEPWGWQHCAVWKTFF